MKRHMRMSYYMLWCIMAFCACRMFVSGSGMATYVAPTHASNESNSSHSCPLNCSEVEFKLLPVSVNFEHVEVYLLVTVFVLLAILAKLLWHLSFLEKFTSNFPESCMLIILGIIFGYLFLGFSYAANNPGYINNITFTPDLFFLVLLPPIVLEAGYFMNNRQLYENALTVALLAFVNTIWNAFGLGLVLYGFSKVPIGDTYIVSSRLTIPNALLFGTFISAVDPVAVLVVFEEIHVNKVLHILVFGESLFNDAVTVVLFNVLLEFANVPLEGIGAHGSGEVNAAEASGCDISMITYQWYDIFNAFLKFFIVNIGGVLIGVVMGYLTCFITRFTDHIRVLEPMFIFSMAYLAYLLAELFELSGIISMIAVAITMKHYVEANISHKSHSVVKYGIKMFAVVSETIISLFIGLYTANFEILKHWDVGLTILTLIGITVFRVSGIFAISSVVNLYRIKKIKFKDQFIMSYSGLRGAVAFCLALISFSGLQGITGNVDSCAREEIETRRVFITTTLTVVFFTVFIQGSTVKYWMKLLHVKFEPEKEKSLSTTIHTTAIDHILSGIEEITGSIGHHRVRDWWERIDTRYLRKIFERYPEGRDEQIIHRFIAKQQKDAYMNLQDLATRHGHCKKSKVVQQGTSCESPPEPACTHDISQIPEEAPSVIQQVEVQESVDPTNRAIVHRHSALFDNICHLMHLSKAKRDPHLRSRHKHLLFEKHDIHLHPHFFHKHKKTVSRKTQDKIIRSELPEHCINEPISHFHPRVDSQNSCLGAIRTPSKPNVFSKLEHIAMEEGLSTKVEADSVQDPEQPESPKNVEPSDTNTSQVPVEVPYITHDEEPKTPLLQSQSRENEFDDVHSKDI